jgi:1-acyl-sn-glycerol-3-phosphate acyltransferase
MKKKLISAYVYGLFIFLMVLALLSAYPVFVLAHLWSKKPRIYFQKIVQQYFRLFYKLMPLMGKIKIINREKANAHHPCVYVSSHQSSIDYTLLASIIDDYVTPSNHFISDYFLFMKIPRNALGVYYIPKGKLDEVDAAYKSFNKALALGSSVIIFPEGTRNNAKELRAFKGGAFRLATEQKVPVVPILINGTGDIVSKGSNVSKTLDKKEVSITFLDPIYPKENEGFVSFRKRVKVEMQTKIENS